MGGIVWTVGFFLLALAVLIVVHEFGHFYVARLCGVKVLRFAVGFGPTLFARKFGADQTEWALCAVPLGGYVKMLDEREAPVAEHERARAFNQQTVGKRIAIVFAGPAANFLLALAVYWVVFMAGVNELRAVVDTPPAGSAAATAGLLRGERVVEVNGAAVTTWQALRIQILKAALDGQQASLMLEAPGGERRTVALDLSGVDRDHLERDFLSPLGVVPEREKLAAVVGMVSPDGVAARAGLMPGDVITRIGEQPVAWWADVVKTLRAAPGKTLTIGYQRAGQPFELELTVASVAENGQTLGRIGIGPKVDTQPSKNLTVVHYNPLAAALRSLETTWDTTRLSLQVMWKMLWGDVSWRNLSGPVAIADYAGRSASMGPSVYVTFIALVSISLGIVNLLPIPVLDGGHLMYYLAEIFKGSPVSERAMAVGQKVGMALLFMLMACALFNDIDRLLGGLLTGTPSG